MYCGVLYGISWIIGSPLHPSPKNRWSLLFFAAPHRMQGFAGLILSEKECLSFSDESVLFLIVLHLHGHSPLNAKVNIVDGVVELR